MTNLWFVNEGLPGRLSSHCSSIQHGRSTALTSSLVALPASLGLLRPVSRTARGLRAPRRRRPSVPALRTACARASSRFAAFNGQRPGRECIFPFRTVPQFSMVVPLRSQARLWHSLLHWAYSALFRAQRARFVRPSPSLARCSVSSHCAAVGGPVFRRCALRVLAPSALRASDCALRFAPCARHSSPSGLHFFASVCIHSSQSSICIARKLACSSRCSLGSLRPVSFLNSQ